MVYYFIDGIVEIYKIVTYEEKASPDSPVSPTMLDIGLKYLVIPLLGSVLQRNAAFIKATVAFDVLAGLVTFVLAQVRRDSF